MDKNQDSPVYVPNSANPFISNGGAKMWKKNYLLLKDDKLRKNSGVQSLDIGVTDMYKVTPVKNML